MPGIAFTPEPGWNLANVAEGGPGYLIVFLECIVVSNRLYIARSDNHIIDFGENLSIGFGEKTLSNSVFAGRCHICEWVRLLSLRLITEKAEVAWLSPKQKAPPSGLPKTGLSPDFATADSAPDGRTSKRALATSQSSWLAKG